MACFSCVAFGGFCGESRNLLKNPLFEETDSGGMPVGWSVSSDPGAVTLTPQSFKGAQALRVAVSKRGTWLVEQEVLLERPGKYELVFFTKITGDAHVRVTWAFTDKDGCPIKASLPWVTRVARQAANWSPVKAMMEAPEKSAKIKVTFRCNMMEGGMEGFVFLDDTKLVSLEERDLTGETLPEGARLVLREDFSSGEIPQGWKSVSGDWKVENNALSGEQGAIFHTGNIGSPNMRVEYTAWTDDARPSDLSAIVASREPVGWAGRDGYFFGFGHQFNTKNNILWNGREVLAEKGGPLEVFEAGIQSGVKHKVVVQRNHNELKLFVDGRLLLEAGDPFFASRTGEIFGFYLGKRGFIDEIKIYALPWKGTGTGTVPERNVEFRMHEGFEGTNVGQRYTGFRKETGSPATQIVDRPTWIYKNPMGNEFVTDHCLEITSSGSLVKLSTPFDPLDSGIIEFDVLAEEHGDLRFAVHSSEGQEIINLIISEDGRYMTEGEQGRRVLRETIRYQRRQFDADFRFMKDMWHTFRLQFSGEFGHLVILDHYSEIAEGFPLGNMGDYLPLGSVDIPSSAVGKKAVFFSVSASGENRLYFDNIVIFGPIGTDTVEGKPMTMSAAGLLGLDFSPRKDPFSLKIQSYRHLTRNNLRVTPMLSHFGSVMDEALEYRNFKPAGNVYNQALIDLVFMEEKINMLRRSAVYLESPALRRELDEQLSRLTIMYESAEQLQEDALNAFAEAYLGGQDARKLDKFHVVVEKIKAEHAGINPAIKNCLKTLMPAAASKDIIQCPAPHEEGGIKWSSMRKRWERNGEPVVCNYFSFGPVHPMNHVDLKMLGFQRYRDEGCNYKRFPGKADAASSIEEGKYINPDDGNWRWLENLQNSGRAGLMMAAAGHGYPVTFAPKWWYEKYKKEDIIFTTTSGVIAENHIANMGYVLNWWHPEVKKLIDEQFSAVGQEAVKYRDAINLIQIGWEIKSSLPGGLTAGYNPSAVQAFQEELRGKYGAIDNLNRLWRSDYKNFNDIVPPQGITKPSGLQYEFRKFLHDGFTSWLGSISDAIHRHAPDIPTASDSEEALGGRLENEAIDPVGFFKAVDIKLYHTYREWDRKFVDRWHSHLSAALGVPWGTKEWIISQGCPYMFQIGKIRNNGLREKAMQMIWGCAMPEYYGAGFGNWQYTTGHQEPRLDRLVFNYTAPYYSLYMERTRRMGKAALVAPLAKPEIGLLETTSSYYNGLGVREGMRPIAAELTERGWNFEFLYEQLLVEGLQTLDGVELLFVPAGLCMPAELVDAVYGWVRKGGVMFSTGGPAGIMDQYGQPSELMKHIFNAEWIDMAGRWTLNGVVPFYDNDVKGWKAVCGKGQVMVFDGISKEIFDLMPSYVEQRIGSDRPELLQLCLREKDGVKHLYALNWSVSETVEATIFLKGVHSSIVDEGLQLSMEVPCYHKEGSTFFRTKLAPAAVTLFRIN